MENQSTTEGLLQKIADLEKRLAKVEANQPEEAVSILLASNDFDKVLPAFIIATGAVGMGMKARIFCTFWGTTALKIKSTYGGKKITEQMMSFMLPAGPENLSLSKMHMMGVGLKMMKGMMADNHVNSLTEMIELAKQMGVKITACQMTMGLMGIKKEEMMDGIHYAGVAAYLEEASQSKITLFI